MRINVAMKWTKLGRIYKPSVVDEYLMSHAANPVAIPLVDNIYRIYFSGRDAIGRSSIGYFDFDVISMEIKDICKRSVYTFDSPNCSRLHPDGVSIGTHYRDEQDQFMLFMGWQVPSDQHWSGNIGRLRFEPGTNSFKLFPDKPILLRDAVDPVSLSYPWVIFENGVYKMWYGSTISWETENGEMLHVINYATSNDGEDWEKHGLSIPYELGLAQAFSRPTVIVNQNGYHMWYSTRGGGGSKYRIGYSSSLDGLVWSKTDFSTIDKSLSGWDEEMMCYPYVFQHEDSSYMLYNGNGYGASGIGMAVLNDK